MFEVAGPGLRDPEAWVFDVDDLAPHGVVFDEVQLELYRIAQHQPMCALAVGFPDDPQHSHRIRPQQQPLFTMDELDIESIVAVPAVVNISPEYASGVLAHEGPPLERFPWLAGRLLTPTHHREWGPDVDLGYPEGFRLWSLWPISEAQATDVLDGIRLWKDNNYVLLQAWFACERGDMDPCDVVVENEGVPYDDHQHREHLDSRGDVQIIECADGEEWMEQFKNAHFRLDSSGLLVPKPMPDLRLCDPDLQQTWEHLRDISAMNTFRAITAIPPSDRVAVLQTERYYSPWLWSS